MKIFHFSNFDFENFELKRINPWSIQDYKSCGIPRIYFYTEKAIKEEKIEKFFRRMKYLYICEIDDKEIVAIPF